jgi:hypothetical protein
MVHCDQTRVACGLSLVLSKWKWHKKARSCLRTADWPSTVAKARDGCRLILPSTYAKQNTQQDICRLA